MMIIPVFKEYENRKVKLGKEAKERDELRALQI
jgi:hypothetical protein